MTPKNRLPEKQRMYFENVCNGLQRSLPKDFLVPGAHCRLHASGENLRPRCGRRAATGTGGAVGKQAGLIPVATVATFASRRINKGLFVNLLATLQA
jgi:hypothetical protein